MIINFIYRTSKFIDFSIFLFTYYNIHQLNLFTTIIIVMVAVIIFITVIIIAIIVGIIVIIICHRSPSLFSSANGGCVRCFFSEAQKIKKKIPTYGFGGWAEDFLKFGFFGWLFVGGRVL